MDIRTFTIELLRAGPRHNQLLSPITQYLGVCGNSPASRVTLPYEHGQFERRLQELRYTVSSSDGRRRASDTLEDTGRAASLLLAGDEAVAANLSRAVDGKLERVAPFRFGGSPADLANATDCLAAAAYYEAGDDPDGEA